MLIKIEILEQKKFNLITYYLKDNNIYLFVFMTNIKVYLLIINS